MFSELFRRRKNFVIPSEDSSAEDKKAVLESLEEASIKREGESPTVGLSMHLSSDVLPKHLSKEKAVKALIDLTVDFTNADLQGKLLGCRVGENNGLLSVRIFFPSRYHHSLAATVNKISAKIQEEREYDADFTDEERKEIAAYQQAEKLFVDRLMAKIEADFHLSPADKNASHVSEALQQLRSTAEMLFEDQMNKMAGNTIDISEGKKEILNAISKLQKALGKEDTPGQEILYSQAIGKMLNEAIQINGSGRA